MKAGGTGCVALGAGSKTEQLINLKNAIYFESTIFNYMLGFVLSQVLGIVRKYFLNGT